MGSARFSIFQKLIDGHFPGLRLTDKLAHVCQRDNFPVLVAARHHRAAGDNDSRDINPGRCHEHSGNDFVAAGQHDHGVEMVRFDHHFHRVGDIFTAGQGIAHAAVPLADAVAESDGAELAGDSARFPDPLFYMLCDFPQMNMPRNHFCK